MYDTQYNRKIANEIDNINKRFIKHEKALQGAGIGLGHETGQQPYCKHCNGSGVSGSGVSGSGVSGSGVSGSGMSGSGFSVSLGFGKKKRGRPSKKDLEGDGGISFGWGKPKPTKKQLEGDGGISFGWGKPTSKSTPTPTPEPENKNMKGGFGVSFGWGKDGKKKRGNPKISQRAVIVKQVMKEQGLGMMQASQYVKAHNL